MKRLIILILAIAYMSQAVAIENGIETRNFPEVVRINTKNLFQIDSGSTCTGVLIGKNTILTARHCLVTRLGFIKDRAIVRLSDGTKATIKSNNFKIHPTADLAIIYMSIEARNFAVLDFSFIVPVNKYQKGMSGAPVTLVGFGGQKLHQLKKTGSNFVFGYDQEQIAISMDPIALMQEVNLSSLSRAQGGDSGAPLFLGHNIENDSNKRLVGIVHANYEHPYKEMQQTWYENLSYYQNWIQKHIKH